MAKSKKKQSGQPPLYLASKLSHSYPIPKKKVADEDDPSISLPEQEKEGFGYGYRGGEIPCSKCLR